MDFTVPNEQDSADIVKVEIFFPSDHPLASVQTEPVPGWTATVTKTKLVKPIVTDDGGEVCEGVSQITWTGGQIRPGEFVQFPVSMGPLPTDASVLIFKALQTYDNNQVMRWIDVPKPANSGGSEPAHPAAMLTLTPASASARQSAAQQTSASASSSSSDSTARVFAVIGILLGAAGVAYGMSVGRRRSGSAQA